MYHVLKNSATAHTKLRAQTRQEKHTPPRNASSKGPRTPPDSKLWLVNERGRAGAISKTESGQELPTRWMGPRWGRGEGIR